MLSSSRPALRFLVITVLLAALYVVAHGATAFVVEPIQSRLFEDVTVFASLLYLPHGLRVISTWIWRWQAIPGLILGALLAEFLYTDASIVAMLQPVLIESILVGALSAYVAFEALRFAGENAYAGQNLRLQWTHLLVIGVVSSLVNSIGQSIVFGGFVMPDDAFLVLLFYAIGDIFGLVAIMLLAVAAFRVSEREM